MSRTRNDANRKRERILYFIIEYKAQNNGVSPTVREIMAGVDGLNSTSNVNDYLKDLEIAGYIKRIPYSPRSIQVVKQKGGNDAIISSD